MTLPAGVPTDAKLVGETDADTVLERCSVLDRFSAHPHLLERVHLSPQHAQANTQVATWMAHAGLRTWVDAAGNQWGRIEGRHPGLPALVLGSHTDTVPDAGSFDGMLGVLMAIAVAQRLVERIALGHLEPLPFALEVVAFSDEEGARFGKALLGSQAAAGTWDDDWFDLRDRNGVTLRTAFRDFGLDPRRVREAARRPAHLVGYLEAHIEQGPFLEAADTALGYVTAIAGARRFRVSMIGEARHAGGTPYPRRRDALTGAGEAIVAIERLGRATTAQESEVIATVGRIAVHPGAVNVIPGRADFSLDLRAETDAARDATWLDIERELGEICAVRGLRLEVVESHRAPAVVCSPWLRDAVIEGISSTDGSKPIAAPMGLWSRAGHDAMAMDAVTGVAMLFLRCFEGISHHPDEDVRADDVAAGLDAFEAAVLAAAATYAGTPAGTPAASTGVAG